MAILVTGAAGQLGQLLCRQLGPEATPAGRSAVDITHRESVLRLVEQTAPSAIINCAAYTHVDAAESEPELCHAVNAQGVANLAEAADEAGCLLVQISTDYVFHGAASRETAFTEDETPSPHSVYAQSKAAGERAASKAGKSLIVRTCGLYSHAGANFVTTMLRLSQQQKVLRVVNDQHCTPSNAEDIARGIAFLTQNDARGVYHLVNTGRTTWFDFAVELFRQQGAGVEVEPISTAAYGAAATRPPFSVLDTTKYHALAGAPAMPSWQSALQTHLRSI